MATRRRLSGGSKQPAPAAKRVRRAPGEDFTVGSVLKVKLKNFMIFTDIEFSPGPRLNLLLGPNGTGKSTFVCGICIGLAGSPKLLGRGDRFTDFIRRGEESAETEVTLRTDDPDRPLVVYRKIKADNSSDWRLNGVNTNLTSVQKKINDMNVQLDNLCQFLPQDRVVAFAQLNPRDLLLETEKAIEGAELYKQHKDLIEKRNDIRGLETTAREHEAQLAKLKEKNELLERDVERIQQREELLNQASLLEKKIPWLHYEVARAEFMKSKDKRKQAMKAVDERKKALQVFTKPLEASKKMKQVAEAERTGVLSELKRSDRERTKIDERMLSLTAEIDQHERELESVREQHQKRQQKMANYQRELEDAEHRLQTLEPPHDNTQDMERMKGDIRQLTIDLKKLQNERRFKTEEIMRPKERLQEITQRLEENRHKFKGEVYGPLILEIQVDNAEHARLLEIAVGYNTLTVAPSA
eukprot:gene16509-19603_t